MGLWRTYESNRKETSLIVALSMSPNSSNSPTSLKHLCCWWLVHGHLEGGSTNVMQPIFVRELHHTFVRWSRCIFVWCHQHQLVTAGNKDCQRTFCANLQLCDHQRGGSEIGCRLNFEDSMLDELKKRTGPPDRRLWSLVSFNWWQMKQLGGSWCLWGILVKLVICVVPGHLKIKILNLKKKISFFAFLCFYIPSKEEKIMGHLIWQISLGFWQIWCPGTTK